MDKYEEMLRQSVNVQLSVDQTLKSLNENTKSLNDKFALHCTTSDDISKEVRAIRYELLKYLKVAIIALIVVLGSVAGIKEITRLFSL